MVGNEIGKVFLLHLQVLLQCTGNLALFSTVEKLPQTTSQGVRLQEQSLRHCVTLDNLSHFLIFWCLGQLIANSFDIFHCLVRGAVFIQQSSSQVFIDIECCVYEGCRTLKCLFIPPKNKNIKATECLFKLNILG